MARAPFVSIHLFRLLGLALAALSFQVAAAPCNPDNAQWNPNQVYPEGAVIFHQGSWYESRELHQGLDPGITFDWKQLDAAPDCANRPTAADTRPATTSAGNTDNLIASRTNPICEKPDQWLFAKRYSAGSEASHGGKVWRATQSTRGDMPGQSSPERWELVEDHCALGA